MNILDLISSLNTTNVGSCINSISVIVCHIMIVWVAIAVDMVQNYNKIPNILDMLISTRVVIMICAIKNNVNLGSDGIN